MTYRPFVVDHATSARIEAAEAAQIEVLARTVAERLPARRAVAIAAIAGGRAAFLAPHISASRAAGLGMSGPVEARDVEALEDFYASRGTEARVLVSPFAHPSLLARLGERGFRLSSLDTVLVRSLDRGPTAEAPAPQPGEARAMEPVERAGVVVRRAAPEEAAAWVSASLSAFAAPGETSPERAAIFEAGFGSPGAAYFFASTAGVIAGTGALYVHERTALLFAGSTHGAHRGQGVQRALIDARLAHARDAGCDLAFSVAQAGSTSQRNLERAGLVPAYSQALLVKSFT
ncbi:GNAT family N-acetyltransferase [Sorangium sp. So ce291]|uniref:GNAT family N-acetyltransferase n=1 Tax=Sorangium sp. So ce291 TaxID=3133294 RepID=UPI003F61F79A